MFKGVTKWLGVVDNTHDEEVSVNAEGEEKLVPKSDDNDDAEKKEVKNDQESKENPENDDLISPQTKQTLEDVSAAAINTAKEWGCMQSLKSHIVYNCRVVSALFLGAPVAQW